MNGHRPTHSISARRGTVASSSRSMEGFTLIEAMVTVAVAIILATMALPSFTQFVANQRVKTVGTDLMIAMTKARNEALMRNANVTVTANAGGWQNGWQTTDAGGNVLASHGAVPYSVVVSAGFTGTSGRVVYQSSGRLHPTLTGSAAFTVTSTKSAAAFVCVKTDLSGRPSTKTTGTCNP